jgi:pimeloyl-ACP methyl ester carboxylesterase
MGGYTDINGHPTWVEQRGSGTETVLLLHGGVSNSDDLLGSIGDVLSERYRVVAFDRRGHGRTADTEVPFHYESMTTRRSQCSTTSTRRPPTSSGGATAGSSRCSWRSGGRSSSARWS